MIPLIDTYAHLAGPKFEHDLAQVRARAEALGVKRVLCMSDSLEEAEAVLRGAVRAEHGPWLQPAIGLHPEYVSRLHDDAVLTTKLHALAALARDHRHQLAAIGAAGLNFAPWDGDHIRDLQYRALYFQLRLAAELSLPLVLHSQSAGRYVLETVETFMKERFCSSLTVCMQRYEGCIEPVIRVLETVSTSNIDWYFSIPPCFVYDCRLKVLVKRLPMSRILLESDAPFPGEGLRAVRAEPAELPTTVRLIAELRNLTERLVRSSLYDNTLRAFPRLRPLSSTSSCKGPSSNTV